MNIANLCKRRVISIGVDATLREAAALMRKEHVGALLVTANAADGAPPRAIGMLTDRDLALEVLARDLDAHGMRVGQVASRGLVTVPENGDLSQAVAAMEAAGVRRLVVTADSGEVTGFVAADDLLAALADELSGLSRALRKGMSREAQQRESIPGPVPRPVFLPHGTPGMH